MHNDDDPNFEIGDRVRLRSKPSLVGKIKSRTLHGFHVIWRDETVALVIGSHLLELVPPEKQPPLS